MPPVHRHEDQSLARELILARANSLTRIPGKVFYRRHLQEAVFIVRQRVAVDTQTLIDAGFNGCF